MNYIKILDSQTMRSKWIEDVNFSFFWWSEGNGSCDCNRKNYYGDYSDVDICKSERFFIIDYIDSENDVSMNDLNLINDLSFDYDIFHKMNQSYLNEYMPVLNLLSRNNKLNNILK